MKERPTMKALTLTQPWATLVAIGAKKIETRSWSTTYRGPLAIHSSKTFPKWAMELIAHDDYIAQALGGAGYTIDRLPCGFVLCTVRLSSIHLITRSSWPSFPELAFGDYTPGRWAWRLADLKPLEQPVEATGRLGLWDWQKPDRP